MTCQWQIRQSIQTCGAEASHPHGFIAANTESLAVRFLCDTHWNKLRKHWLSLNGGRSVCVDNAD